MIKIKWVKEIIVLGLILAQALFIMYNKNAKPLVFYGVQAIICIAVISIRLKDLIALVKTLLNAIKAKKNGIQKQEEENIQTQEVEESSLEEGEKTRDGRD